MIECTQENSYFHETGTNNCNTKTVTTDTMLHDTCYIIWRRNNIKITTAVWAETLPL